MSLYTCVLHTLRVLYGRETLVELVLCLKRLMTVAFGSSEPFHLGVSVTAPSLHRESTDSLISVKQVWKGEKQLFSEAGDERDAIIITKSTNKR